MKMTYHLIVYLVEVNLANFIYNILTFKGNKTKSCYTRDKRERFESFNSQETWPLSVFVQPSSHSEWFISTNIKSAIKCWKQEKVFFILKQGIRVFVSEYKFEWILFNCNPSKEPRIYFPFVSLPLEQRIKHFWKCSFRDKKRKTKGVSITLHGRTRNKNSRDTVMAHDRDKTKDSILFHAFFSIPLFHANQRQTEATSPTGNTLINETMQWILHAFTPTFACVWRHFKFSNEFCTILSY